MNRCEGGECSRDGSGVIEIYGTNFGNNEKALVFANGLRCNETEQPSENLLLCSLEPSTRVFPRTRTQSLSLSVIKTLISNRASLCMRLAPRIRFKIQTTKACINVRGYNLVTHFNTQTFSNINSLYIRSLEYEY